MSFASELRNASKITYTENGGQAIKSMGGALLDLFATVGALRSRSEDEMIAKWRKAREETPEYADNIVLYARDIRNGGCGERRTGRILLKELAKIEPEKVARNLDKIVEVGRWDDLFTLFDTPAEDAMIEFVKEQFMQDVKDCAANKPISQFAKWCPSINTSSAATRALARRLTNKLQLSEATYRKTLSRLRKHIKIVEGLMSSNKWDSINFEAVPSVAMKRYTNAFRRNCGDKFSSYIDKLQSGEAKVNSSTLYPYDIIQPAIGGYYIKPIDAVQEAQWKALPNYVEDENVLFMVDTSGSMTCDNGRPLATAIGLGIYFAQRNTGVYHNLYMSFSSDPEILEIKDEWSLSTCVDQVARTNWQMSTDLDRAFRKVYNIAARSGEAPAAICIVSDMEINNWGSEDQTFTITDKWKNAFEGIGLEMPKLIYWNVCARSDVFHASKSDNVGFVSGYGVNAFKNFQKLLTMSATDAMIEILGQEIFSWR